MSNYFVNQVFDGGILVAIAIALVAGVISFASPCVIPLVPGYLAYTSGVAATRRRVFLEASLFIFGFSILFISYGALFGILKFQIIKLKVESGLRVKFLVHFCQNIFLVLKNIFGLMQMHG